MTTAERDGTPLPPRWLIILVAAPGLLGAVGALMAVAAAALHLPPVCSAPLSLAEAAAIADHAEIARMTRDGLDAQERAGLRRGILDLRAHTMSAIEAADVSHQPAIKKLLEQRTVR